MKIKAWFCIHCNDYFFQFGSKSQLYSFNNYSKNWDSYHSFTKNSLLLDGEF